MDEDIYYTINSIYCDKINSGIDIFNINNLLKNKKNILEYCIKFSFSDYNIDKFLINSMLENNYIFKNDSISTNKYSLTIKSLILCQYHPLKDPVKAIASDMQLFFNNLYDDKFKNTDIFEKSNILFLISLFAYEDDKKIRIVEDNKYYYKEYIDKIASLICNINKIDISKYGYEWKAPVGEDDILGSYRRLNKLPIKTNNIFRKTNTGLYISILEYGKENTIHYLLDKIFDNSVPFEEIESLNRIMYEIFSNRSYFIKKSESYSIRTFDENFNIIKKIIFDSFL